MTATQALGDMILAAVFVALLAVWAEPLVQRRRAKVSAAAPAAVVQAPESEASAPTNSLDVAWMLALEQASAAAEVGRGWALPTRQQVSAQMASITGEHDEIEDIPAIELLTFAALVDGLRERPRAVADTDPGEPGTW